MKKLLVVLFTLSSIILSQEKQKELYVTVYNSNFGVVRDIREVNLNEGKNKLSFTDVAQKIDATSVFVKFDGTVLEQNYQYDLVSLSKILQKYIDKKIELIKEDGTLLTGILLSAFGEQIVLQKDDGGLEMIPSTEEYRISVGKLPDGLKTKPTLVWDLVSEKSGRQDLELSYHTRGMNWNAEYVAVLSEDEKTIDLNAWVSLDNRSGGTFKDAKLKLLAGDVNMTRRGGKSKRSYNESVRLQAGVVADQISEKELFEYHIYEVNRPVTLANNEIKQISLFTATDVNVKKKFIYSNHHGKFRSSNKVSVYIEFANEEKNNLGVPFPAGRIRVNKQDGKSVEFIGEDRIDHTPKKEKLNLLLGNAFDIVAEEKTVDSERISKRTNEYEYEIKFKNRKKESVTIEVIRNLGRNWEIINENIKHKKNDAYSVTYFVDVPVDSEKVLRYRVRNSY